MRATPTESRNLSTDLSMNRSSDFPFRKDASNDPIRWHTCEEGGLRFGRLTSQEWRGLSWVHDVLMQEAAGDTCVLNISGDFVEGPDLADFVHLASRTKLPTVSIFGVPNQPLWDRREDDLIAHTFENWLESGENEDLLLAPMIRSVLAAMDAPEAEFGFQKFVIAGASKRGWTAWLTALTQDPRIIGLVPIVFDNLNFRAQMIHQIALWGDFSPKLGDYSVRGLQDLLGHPKGDALAALTDPFHYLDRLHVPFLVINGGNDAFWAVDALARYWDALPAQKSALIVPNAGHDLGDRKMAYQALGQFARLLSRGEDFPRLSLSEVGDLLTVESSQKATNWCLYTSVSPTLNFSEAVWTSQKLTSKEGNQVDLNLKKLRTSSPAAILVMADFEGEHGEFSLTTPARILLPRS